MKGSEFGKMTIRNCCQREATSERMRSIFSASPLKPDDRVDQDREERNDRGDQDFRFNPDSDPRQRSGVQGDFWKRLKANKDMALAFAQ